MDARVAEHRANFARDADCRGCHVGATRHLHEAAIEVTCRIGDPHARCDHRVARRRPQARGTQRRLERTTTGSGPLAARTLAELKQLYTRNRDGTLSEERIPTLLELIAASGAQTPLLLELKDPLFLEPSHAAALAQTLAATGMTQRVALVSFHFDYVQAVQAALLPKNLGEALTSLTADDTLRDGFGKPFIDYYVHLKNAELARFRNESGKEQPEPTAWEQREYFDLF